MQNQLKYMTMSIDSAFESEYNILVECKHTKLNGVNIS